MLKSPAFSTSFLESRMIQKLKSRKSRIKPGLFAFLLAGRIIFGKKTHRTGENTGFSPVFFLYVLHGYVVHWGSDFGFPHRPHLLHPSPAPETHPVSPFSDDFGRVFSFFAVFRVQNIRLRFCASCHIVFTD